MAATDRLKSSVALGARAAAGKMLCPMPTRFWRKVFPKTAVGLCYHMVSDSNPPHLKHYPALATADFEADLTYLKRDFGFISYEQLAERRNSGNLVRDNRAIVTFDDGFAQCANVAAPILRHHGVGCVFFIITDLIDNAVIFRESKASLCIGAVFRSPIDHVEAIVHELGLDKRLRPPPERAAFAPANHPLDVARFERLPDPLLLPLLHWLLTLGPDEEGLLDQLATRLDVDSVRYLRAMHPYLTKQQILQLQADGFTIGAHGCSHRRLQDLSLADAEREIVESCRIICDLTGKTSAPFAFPYFGGGIDREWLAELRRRHENIGLIFDSGGLRDDAPFVVQRVFAERIAGDRTMDAILRRAWSRRPAWSRQG